MPHLVPNVVPRGTLSAHAQPCLRAGESLLLRPWQAGDVPTVVTAYTDPDIQRWHLQSMDAAEARAWIERCNLLWQSETGVGWAVTDAASGTVLGRVGLRELHIDEGRAEVAYWVLPAARGRAVASSALEALSSWAFGEIGLHRLDLQHSVHNPASCRVAARTGFALEGLARSSLLHQDGWHDVHLHARISPAS